jgi:hypothetical protein
LTTFEHPVGISSISSSFGDGSDDMIAECLLYEEQDLLMSKELVRAGLQKTIERVLKGYMNTGRDSRVLVKMFEVTGLIDGVLIEHGELKSIQILQKV